VQTTRRARSWGVRAPARALSFGLALVAAAAMAGGARAADSDEAAATFNRRCTACHTFGHGVKVGPDLKGVTERRTRPWLLKFVRGSSLVIAAGDPTATRLFADFKEVRMPDWSDLSETQVSGILDWFAADGPEHQKPPDERSATLADASDVEAGRRLFDGRTPLANGGQPCANCHTTRDAASRGASLGPELTNVYVRYQDRALTAFFKRPCLARLPDSAATRYLSGEETFALKAYLRAVAISNHEKGGAR
jgi:cytochrome c2